MALVIAAESGAMKRGWRLVDYLGIALVLVPSAASDQTLNIDNFDPDKGSVTGSPLDHLPEHIRLLDIDLPNGATPMRADWSPDGDRLVFLDAPIGDGWEYDLDSGVARNLTATVLPGCTAGSSPHQR